jgi:ABC-2 type transport system permease protein
MDHLSDMIWIELRKAIRSRMPLWTALGSLFMPLGIAFLIFVARNPEISRQLGLISAKADLMAYAVTDWATYLGLSGQIVAIAGLLLFSLVASWVFGREFADGTLKDLLAVPVPRSSILLAKFSVVAAWSAMLAIVILAVGLVMGAITGLPGGSLALIVRGGTRVIITAGLTMAVAMPMALFAGVGRGYLLPIGAAILAMMAANVVALAGWGEYFPWAVPGLYAMDKDPMGPVSYGIVFLTGLAGMIATGLWWKYADQSR